MALPIGTRVGPYEITGVLGAGGMGEVYRARDARLGRDVALKVLPEVFATDPERLARFEREAQVLAALKHPNIGAIYAIEDRALVLELVEGETLADRIARGPIPLDEALPIATQIAEALQAAHEQGIIHRDLKPTNIKVAPDGSVKVLDFGLAKLTESGGASRAGDTREAALAHLSMSPTLTSPAATGLGVILGTAAYMAPEQAKGRPADKRSDVWAFGCVLFEMLTGKRAFDAEDVSDTLALVLKGEPQWTRLPAALTSSVRVLIPACLEKDQRLRLTDFSGVLFVLSHQSELTSTVVVPVSPDARRRSRRYALIATMALVSVVVGAGIWLAMRPVAPQVARFWVAAPEQSSFVTGLRSGTSVAISPDGQTLAFSARDEAGKTMIWLRSIDAVTARPLAGTDGAQFPFWSPDSKFIGYFTQDKLLKIAAAGGPPQMLCTVVLGRGGTWNPEGEIVYGENTGPLYRVPASGGTPVAITTLDNSVQDHRFPSFLPDGRHLLYFPTLTTGTLGVWVLSLDSGETKRLLDTETGAVYDARNRLLLFGRQGVLMAQPFDSERLTVAGDPFPVAEQLESGVYGGVVSFSVANNGTLAYGTGSAMTNGIRLIWVDRTGRVVGNVGPIANYREPELAPDGRRLAVKRRESATVPVDTGDIWITDLPRDTTSRFTFDSAQSNSAPIWSPDGNRIAFASLRGGKWGLYVKPWNGTGSEQRLLEANPVTAPVSWSPDGQSIVYVTVGATTATDLWLMPLSGDRKPTALVATRFNENRGQVSPDGHWFAYDSNESGQSQVYVRPFPSGDGKWQVSSALAAYYPRWRGDGRELFYMDAVTGGKLMAVDVKMNGTALEIGTPRVLFDSGYANLGGERVITHAYAVTPDGQRFLIPRLASNSQPERSSPIVVTLNWNQTVKR